MPGLYYDGNTGVWYSYDHQLQQYTPCTDQNDNKTFGKESEPPKAVDGANNRKVIISAPAATISAVEKPASLPDAVQAAATAALAAEKKGKDKSKEIKLASKSVILANKKKINNASMWKQWSHDNQQTASADDKSLPAGQSAKSKFKSDSVATKDNSTLISGASSVAAGGLESSVKPKPVSNSSGGTIMGVIRNSGKGFNSGSFGGLSTSSTATLSSAGPPSTSSDMHTVVTPFRTDASALGSYTPPVASGSGKRRFSEMPASSQKEPPQTTYRDRAAERRSLYGSSSIGDDLPDAGFGDPSKLH